MKNDDLMKQLRELEVIESNISNKNRIIDQVNYNIQEQNTGIKNLIISTILAVILFITVLLHGTNKINYIKFISILSIVTVCYLFLYLYTYNIFYLKDSMSYLFNARSINSIENKLTTWSKEVKTYVTNELKESEKEWENNNCTCPPSQEEDDRFAYPIVNNTIVNEIPGHFYNDGSAPPQLLIPTPNPASLGLNQSIDWVDYSSNGNVSYNPNTNKVGYDNKNYYNYKNLKDPMISLKKEINNFNTTSNGTSLVDNRTNSTNF